MLKTIFDSADPHREQLPGKWNETFDDFQKLIVLKGLRPDKITNAMQDYVAKYLGQRFIEPQVCVRLILIELIGCAICRR